MKPGIPPGNRSCSPPSYSAVLQTLQASSDLKTSACCTAKAPSKEVVQVLRQLPDEIITKYYGCGSPFPVGLKGSGLRVLDLGCGTGRDCYVCAALVGEKGFVTGQQLVGVGYSCIQLCQLTAVWSCPGPIATLVAGLVAVADSK